MPVDWLPKGAIVFNASYQDSTFNGLAAQRGCRVIPGEWWLHHQALKSFSLFMGCSVPTVEMGGRLFSPLYSPLKLSRVALIGFMGSGKTAVGRLLAARSGLAFVDTDDVIARAEGLSIRNIFDRHGEAAFRAKEKEVIQKLSKEKGILMACGGGAVLDQGIRQILRNSALVIWLCASPKTIVSRVRNETRPLLDGNDVQKTVGQLLSVRQPVYFKTADLIVDADGDAEEVARNIHEEINSAIGS
jgi:shikimate kinase